MPSTSAPPSAGKQQKTILWEANTTIVTTLINTTNATKSRNLLQSTVFVMPSPSIKTCTYFSFIPVRFCNEPYNLQFWRSNCSLYFKQLYRITTTTTSHTFILDFYFRFCSIKLQFKVCKNTYTKTHQSHFKPNPWKINCH